MSKLKGSTWIKVILIVVLCLIVCISFAVGTTSCSSDEAAQRHEHSGMSNHVYSGPSTSTTPEAPSLPSPGDSLGTLVSSDTFMLDEAREIDVNWAAGSVDVYVVPDDDCDGMIVVEEYFSGSGKGTVMQMSSQNGCLSLDYGNQHEVLTACSRIGAKHLVVTIPESAATTLERFALNAASGEHVISGVTCGEIELNLASGTLSTYGVSTDNLITSVASGTCTIDGTFASSMDIDVASGNVNITNDIATCAVVDISLMSGNVNLCLPENTDFVADVDKLSGDFTCGFPCDYYEGHYESHEHGQHGAITSTISISIASGKMRLDPIG